MGLNESRACTVTNYQYVGEPWEAKLLYRTQTYLEVREPQTRSRSVQKDFMAVCTYEFAATHGRERAKGGLLLGFE